MFDYLNNLLCGLSPNKSDYIKSYRITNITTINVATNHHSEIQFNSAALC